MLYFKFIKSKIKSYLNLVMITINKKQKINDLNGIFIESINNKIILKTSNLDTKITVELDVEDQSVNGKIFIEAEKFYNIIKSLPDDIPITIEENNVFVIITCGAKIKFRLSKINLQDLSEKNQDKAISQNKSLEITLKNLYNILKKTSFSMDNKNINSSLNGMLWKITKDNLIMVSTDNYRMSITKALINNKNFSSTLSFVVPKQSIIEILKILSIVFPMFKNLEEKTLVNINIYDNKINLKFVNFKFYTKIIEDNFPNYKNVIPKENNKIVEINKNILKTAIIRASLLSNTIYTTLVILNFYKNCLSVSSNNSNNEQAIEKIDIIYAEESIELAINKDFILDVINNIDTSEINFNIKNSSTIIKIKDKTSIYLISPIKL